MVHHQLVKKLKLKGSPNSELCHHRQFNISDIPKQRIKQGPRADSPNGPKKANVSCPKKVRALNELKTP